MPKSPPAAGTPAVRGRSASWCSTLSATPSSIILLQVPWDTVIVSSTTPPPATRPGDRCDSWVRIGGFVVNPTTQQMSFRARDPGLDPGDRDPESSIFLRFRLSPE
jgi:hypothetical protein